MTDLVPVSLTDRMAYSKALAASDLLPKQYRDKPANVLVAVEYGAALGLSPMAAIQGIHVVEGKPTASAQLIGALVRNAGHLLRVTGDDLTATAQIVRRDDPDFTFECTWTMDRAKQAGLAGKTVWKQYPAAMLKARAVTEVARDACPEVLAGVSYTAEEMEHTPPPVRVVDTQRLHPQPANLEPQQEELVADEDGVIIDAELVEEPQEAPASAAQLRMIHSQLSRLGIANPAEGLAMLSDIAGRTIDATKDLTMTEAGRAIDTLGAIPDPDENPAGGAA